MTDTDPSEELVDVLDDMGQVLETVTRARMRAENLLHRSVFVVVRNDADELLVHRRADWKDVWPGAWDIAVGGVVATGEAWDLAASRELIEELGVAADLEYLGEGEYADESVRELARVYAARSEGPFQLVDDEIVEVVWLPMSELRVWVAEHHVCPDSLALVLPRLDAA